MRCCFSTNRKEGGGGGGGREGQQQKPKPIKQTNTAIDCMKFLLLLNASCIYNI